MNNDVERQNDLSVQAASSVGEVGTPAEATSAPRMTLSSMRAAAEIHAISRALEQTGWNRRRAAEMLSISYRGLLYKIRRHNITPPANPGLTPLVQR
jgi:two-component system, NtrC family, response regulator AtoC